MAPQIATVFFIFAILGLFVLDRHPNVKTSKALWVPVIWLWIAGSRNVSEWLHLDAPTNQGERYLEGSPTDRAILTILIAIGILVLIARRHRIGQLLRSSTPLLFYFTYCAISITWSDYPDVSFKRWVRAIGDVVMIMVILSDEEWLWALKRVLARVGFVLLPLSVLFTRYYPAIGRGFSSSGQFMYWTGVTTDKNGLGMICLIFGLASVWRFIEIFQGREGTPRSKPILAQGILVLTTLWLLWESNSVTSISCFVLAVGLIAIPALFSFARKPVVVFLLATVAIGVSTSILFSGGGGGVLHSIGRNTTLTGRTEVWHAVLRFAENPMIGTGYESFWLGDRITQIGAVTEAGIQQAHNGYLEIYVNLGWIGLACLAIIIIAGYRRLIFAVRQDPAAGKLRLAYFVLAIVYNFTEAGFKMMNPVWIFFLLSVIALPARVEAESPVTVGLDPALVPRTRGDYPLEAVHPRGMS